MNIDKKLRRACFTGHRPEKLVRSKEEILDDLERTIFQAVGDGINVFITGMSRGVDIWAAQIILKLRDDGYPVRLICACPYDGFEKKWDQVWQEEYNAILAKADFVKYISDKYSGSCFQTRNEWMVNHVSRVIAVFNGEKSGTKNTIDYACKNKIPVIYING